MFQNICAIPLEHDLFTQAVHPQECVIAVGLSSGHVQTYRLPDSATAGKSAAENGFGHIDSPWRTRRHKGSCRALAFGNGGTQLYSAGTDGIVKAADVATGKVTAKIAIPSNPVTHVIDSPTLLHALSPQTLLLATDSAALHLYDLRHLGPQEALKPDQTHRPHDDYISSLTPLPPTSDSTSGFSKQWISTGGTTLAVTDLRRGVLVRSEDQEEELLSSIMVTGLRRKGTSVGEKVVVGGATGVLTLWERGVWDDQDERIIVDKSAGVGDSVDALSLLPEGVSPSGKVVAAGLGNGFIRFVSIGRNKIIGEVSHDEIDNEAVIGLDFDVAGRMVSGGGKTVKVWGPKKNVEDNESDDDELEGQSYDATVNGKHSADSDSNESGNEENGADGTMLRNRRKKRKIKGVHQKGHGILGFSGLT